MFFLNQTPEKKLRERHAIEREKAYENRISLSDCSGNISIYIYLSFSKIKCPAYLHSIPPAAARLAGARLAAPGQLWAMRCGPFQHFGIFQIF
jgi:predicted AAA+ superfamily ATPase